MTVSEESFEFMNEVEVKTFTATAHDRCDSCGAQAYTLAQKNGLELLFCGHHSKGHREKMFQEGWDILDDHTALASIGLEFPVLTSA